MRFVNFMLCVVFLACSVASARAGDPFDNARYYIGTKNNAAALQDIDSGQFDINMQTSEGYTLLHYAAEAGNLAMVDSLLERGANPSIKTNLGSTPFDMAIGTMVQTRLKAAMAGGKSASPQAKGTGDFDTARANIGWRRNDVVIAELDKGLDVNMQNAEGYTLLHFAAGEGNLAIVKELLQRGANPNTKTNSGQTALDRAMGTMVEAELKKAGGKLGISASLETPAKPVAQPAATTKPKANAANDTPTTPNSPYAKMCESRHYTSSALCSDSTCKMREYRKWQTCLKTGSYY
ncbi:ankyrin repeat domain-containing protein [Govanella unica]|uniref:Ankyrin repeat domain-containing protein n=1 Tax=Govanella unica TaxID=2975056 RepID=A0A9X3Z5X1_9PROT|nr:ankyrin repeat domain-containing protein [Govania unica]MDA5192570.1 ankyrin repeat domain-containing protein [Govania unica]